MSRGDTADDGQIGHDGMSTLQNGVAAY